MVGFICLGLWLRSGKQKTARVGNAASVLEAEIVSDEEIIRNLAIPGEWDEKFIVDQVNQARNRPWIVIHYLQSLFERFNLRVDNHTNRERGNFIRSVIDQVNVTTELYVARKNFDVAAHDLQMRSVERQIKELELQIQRETLETKRKSQDRLAALQLLRDELALKVEIGRLNKELDAQNTQPASRPSREEERAKKRAASEQRIKDLSREKLADLVQMRAAGESEESVTRRENMWSDTIFREEEELRRWL